jgi:hypothetical protein
MAILIFLSHIFLSGRSGVAETMITAASVLGKGDPKSGQIAGHLDRQPHLKSRHSRTYAPGCEWHATWLFNKDDRRESPQLVSGGNDVAACLASPIFA